MTNEEYRQMIRDLGVWWEERMPKDLPEDAGAAKLCMVIDYERKRALYLVKALFDLNGKPEFGSNKAEGEAMRVAALAIAAKIVSGAWGDEDELSNALTWAQGLSLEGTGEEVTDRLDRLAQLPAAA